MKMMAMMQYVADCEREEHHPKHRAKPKAISTSHDNACGVLEKTHRRNIIHSCQHFQSDSRVHV